MPSDGVFAPQKGQNRRVSITIDDAGGVLGENPMLQLRSANSENQHTSGSVLSIDSDEGQSHTHGDAAYESADDDSDDLDSDEDDLDECERGHEQPISKQGWMHKKGGYKRRNWKRSDSIEGFT